MRSVEAKLRRLSFNQLRALAILSRTKNGLVSSSPTGESMGITGKALGGLFSSLARQKVNGQPLLFPYGQGEIGRGLRWKLNTKLVSIEEIREIIDELLSSWE